MGNRSHLQKKASSQSTFTPVTNPFQPRPFAPPKEISPQQQETPDLQAEQEKPKGFGYNLGKISITNRNGVGRLPIQTKLTIGQPGDKYEQEADSVAAQVVNQINAPVAQQSVQGQTVQRQDTPEEEELMMKPMVQRQEALGGGTATPDLEASIKQARGSGQPLGEQIRTKMEGAFGANFSSVKIHTDAKSDLLNRSIQARAFTTGQDIFFRQGAYNPGSRGGQELLAHELTHVVQQKGNTIQRNTIQCKMANITSLPEEMVGKSSWYRTSKESEKIQKQIEVYNQIKNDDKNYSNQRKTLTEIISLCKNWLKVNSDEDKKADKQETIAKISLDAEMELFQVEQQEQQGDGQNDYRQRSDGASGDIGDVASNVKTGLNNVGFDKEALTSGATKFGTKVGLDKLGLHEKFGKKIGGAIAGDGKTLANQTSSLFNAIKTSADTDVSLFDEKNAGTKSIIDNYRNISGLTTVGVDGQVGPKIMSFGDTLMNWSFVGSVLGVVKSIYDAYSVWGEWQSFAKAQKAIKENKDNGESISDALQDAIEHGVGKIKRRFWSVISNVITKVIDIISYILTATGVAAAVGAIMNLGTTLLNTIALLGRKIKGLWKFVKKTRGAHRAQSADTLVQSALGGDKISLQILLDIDPLGTIGRAKIGAQRGLDVAREQGSGIKGKAGWVAAGAWREMRNGEYKVKTPDEMKQLLINIKNEPDLFNMNINEFTAAVAEKLKSQA